MYQRSGSIVPQPRAKPPIASTGKPTPAKPKAGEQMMPVRRQAEGEVPAREAGAARPATDRPTMSRQAAAPTMTGSPRNGISKKPWMMHEADSHHDEEDAEIGRELADKRRERTAAGRRQPFAHAARAELRADRIAAGDRDHDVQHGRQDRPQQELRVVQGGIGEHILLDHERTGRERQRPADPRGRSADGRRNRRLQRTRGDVARREELLVEEDDDLRPPPICDVALEVLGDIDRGDGLARADGMHGAVEIRGALRHRHAWRRADRLDEGLRGLRAVLVDDVDPEIADHGIAEGGGQQRKGNQRDAEDEQQRDPVAPDPDRPRGRRRRRCRDGARSPSARPGPVRIGAHAGPAARGRLSTG